MTQLIITTPEMLEEIITKILLHNIPPTYLQPSASPKSILNIDEASELLGIPKNTLYRYTSSRLIPHQKIGRSLKFRRDDLLTWLEENKRKTNKEIQNEY